MFYYVLGILIIAVARLYMNIEYKEHKVLTSAFHEIGVILMCLYIVMAERFMLGNNMNGIISIIVSSMLFVPVGIAIPMFFNRHRKLLNFLVDMLILVLCLILCLFVKDKELYLVAGAVMFAGTIVGYIVFKINSEVFDTVKKKFLLRKRKGYRLPGIIVMEADFMVGLLVAMFFVASCTHAIFPATQNATANVSAGENNKKPPMKKEEESTKQQKATKYSDIYYADEEDYERYDAYAALHPEYSLEQVVLEVEMYMDCEQYTNIYEYPVSELDPLLVNKFHKVPDSFVPQTLETVYGEFQTTHETKEAFESMRADAKELGYDLYIVSAYRSVSYQYGLYNTFKNRDGQEAADTYSARGGCSEHCTGRALDISNNESVLEVFDGTDEWKWCVENAYKYGFILRYPEGHEEETGFMYECWQFTYVGVDVATTMKEENIPTLEEYTVKYIEHTP